MFSSLLDRMGASSRASTKREITRAPSSDSLSTAITVDDLSNAHSSSSTPPTSIGDDVSVSSSSGKPEATTSDTVTIVEQPLKRSQRARASVGTYNVKVLSGTAIHAPKKYLKNADGSDKASRRRTISGDTLVDALGSTNSSTETFGKGAQRLVSEGIDALDLSWSVKKLPKSASQTGLVDIPNKKFKQSEDPSRRKSLRSTGEEAEGLTKKLSVLGKRGRKNIEGISKPTRELRNLADTKEFAKIETEPVVFEVWSNGKLVPQEPARKKKKAEEVEAPAALPETKPEPEKKIAKGKKDKFWLKRGIYAGQDPAHLDWFKASGNAKSQFVVDPDSKPRSILPLPLWQGQRLLHVGRDFKLPFDVCSPLPPGQPKPTEWFKTSSNRFIGEAASMWKKSKLFDSFFSKCICKPETGCDEDCQNRIMLYECDDTNCGAGRDNCTNRAFAELQIRRKGDSTRKGGNKFDIGVEVFKTADRGYGVRSNRCFNAQQIIVEYTGEIITEDECDRRMNEDYKNNECYYLMSFDQNMIIDATKGSIARFVNHSCRPNCRMVKWIVEGKPRMALFAGDNPIMTGDELTYDYNFDPFSAKNVQECRCGSDNCRGFLGPKPKNPTVTKSTTAIKDAVKAGLKAGKRKLQEMIGGDDDDGKDPRNPKKRRTKAATGAKRSVSSTIKEVTKKAPKSTKETVTNRLLNARNAISSRKTVTFGQTATTTTLKTYGKKQMKLTTSNSTLTMVASTKNPRVKNEPVSPEKGSARSGRASRHSTLSDDGNEKTGEVGPAQTGYVSTLAVKPAPVAKSWAHFVAGGVGGMTAAAVTAPLDVLKTRLQSDFYQAQLAQSRLAKGISPHTHLSPLRSGLLHFRETFQILFSVHRIEGWRSLFKGLGPNLVGVVPARSINFFVVGNGKRIIGDYTGAGPESAWVVCCAAALAGITTSTVTNPIWLIKTRLQLDKSVAERSGDVVKRRYKNSWDCIKQVVRGEGVRGLYKGMSASYLGVTESTLQWVLFEQGKSWMARRNQRIALSKREKNIWDKTIDWTGTLFIAGGAKLVAALGTYPHEVIRTRLRQAPSENGVPKYTGLVQCAKLVFKEEGMVALYGGLTPHLLRTVPSAAIMFGMYEGILKVLHAPA
ncbi:Histone-lysine N-methyltransferase ASH1L protein [Rutstroemia sp. NJR-2017a BBW]|nr:Histone-lysine N-methyltransferase ASH1L protein [Rutstroemia sp. NJR-2017a BBW]